jgi:hypothetical protein
MREQPAPLGEEQDEFGERNLPVHQLDVVDNPIWKGRYFPDEI